MFVRVHGLVCSEDVSELEYVTVYVGECARDCTYMKSNGPCSCLCSVELWSSDVGDYQLWAASTEGRPVVQSSLMHSPLQLIPVQLTCMQHYMHQQATW